MRKQTRNIFVVMLVLPIAATLLMSAPIVAFGQSIKIRYSSDLPSKHYVSAKMMPSFAEKIQERTGDRVKIELYSGGELYKSRESIEAVTMGAIEMAHCSLGHWAGRNPIFEFTNLFFMLKSDERWEKARDDVFLILDPLFEKYNTKLLHFIAYGGVCIHSRVPIKKNSDFKGLKLRGGTKGHKDSIVALGATPASIAAAEVYDAVSKGAIDGATAGWSSFLARKLYEVSKYGLGPVIGIDPWPAYMNLGVWKRLPSDVKKIIMEVSEEIEKDTLNEKIISDTNSMKELHERGVTLTMIPIEEIEKWETLLEPVYEDWLKRCEAAGYGREAKKIMEAIR